MVFASASSVAKASPSLRPERAQDVGRQVLGAGHHRRGRGQRREVLGRRGGLRAALVDIGLRAERGDVATAELAPVGEDRRQNLADLGGPEPAASP